jgi:hypothetical protein
VDNFKPRAEAIKRKAKINEMDFILYAKRRVKDYISAEYK